MKRMPTIAVGNFHRRDAEVAKGRGAVVEVVFFKVKTNWGI